jgi:hypothetical protein
MEGGGVTKPSIIQLEEADLAREDEKQIEDKHTLEAGKTPK